MGHESPTVATIWLIFFRHEPERSSERAARRLRREDLLRLVLGRAGGFCVADVGARVAPQGLDDAGLHLERVEALLDGNPGVDGGRRVRLVRQGESNRLNA